MKLQIYDLEGFTTYNENNGADQLYCYHRFSHDAAQFLFSRTDQCISNLIDYYELAI